jgi:hypothetical protein
MTGSAVLQAWREGASIITLGALLNEEPKGIEDVLRLELERGRGEFRPGPPPPAGNGGAPPSKGPRAGRKPGRQPKPAAAPTKAAPAPAGEFGAYPERLRDPRSTQLRKVWDVLSGEATPLADICEAMGLPTEECRIVSSALYRLKEASLAERTDDGWRRA